MMKKKAHYTKVEDFLLDDDFIRYTFDNSAEGVSRWSVFTTAAHPAHQAFLHATNILLHLDDCKQLTESQVQRLKRRIFRSLNAVVN